MSRQIFEEYFIGTEAVAVVIACHHDYLKYLPDQIAHIDSQTVRPVQRILAYDGPNWQRVTRILRRCHPGWIVIGGHWKSPAKARNAAMRVVYGDWVVFADADDFLPFNYFAHITKALANVPGNCAILYPDLRYSNGQTMKAPPTFKYWGLRMANYVSAASAWRLDALREGGGFDALDLYEDWGLALRLTADGWRGQRLAAPLFCRWHPGRRSASPTPGASFAFKWTQLTYAIVTLISGRRECWRQWNEWLKAADLPPRCSFWLMDNSRDSRLGETIKTTISGWKYKTHYLSCSHECPDPGNLALRHQHVADLYNLVFQHPRFCADFVVTLEDDVLPPPDGLRRLVEAHQPGTDQAATAAVYPSRRNPQELVGRRLL